MEIKEINNLGIVTKNYTPYRNNIGNWVWCRDKKDVNDNIGIRPPKPHYRPKYNKATNKWYWDETEIS